jgi:hypothetical protein
MAFDLYVGSFTRYILGAWENVGQRTAREHGVEYKLIRDNETEEAPGTPTEILEQVVDWRRRLNAGLEAHLPAPLDWEESEDTPYVTDRPEWHGWAALLLLAAHDDNPKLALPLTVPEEWGDDPAYKASTEDDSETRYPTLLMADLWLPGDFDFMFGVEDLGGNPRAVASTRALRDELRDLNGRTFQATDAQLAAWAKRLPAEDAPLQELARSTLGMALGLAEEALKLNLPMMPDY